MCRYRVYHHSCGHDVAEARPYLPCNTEDWCTVENSTDKPIKINQASPCGQAICQTSQEHPELVHSPHSPTGTSWEQTNSRGHRNGAGEDGTAGAKLRETVDRKMKESSFVKIARSLTKKGRKDRETPDGHGQIEFVDQRGPYAEIPETSDTKKY